MMFILTSFEASVGFFCRINFFLSSFSFFFPPLKTYIGPVVISVNPYAKVDIFTKEHLMEYAGRSYFELPPHIYALADAAYV